MALAQKSDNGSRKKGRELAISKILALRYGRSIPPGQCGLYWVGDLKVVKAIVERIRSYERYYGNSKCNQVYNKAFFDLDGFFSEEYPNFHDDDPTIFQIPLTQNP